VNPVTADPAAVERVLAETGVERVVPPPGWTGYLQVLVDAVTERFFSPIGQTLAGARGWFGPIATIVVAVAVVLVVWLFLASLARRRTDRAPASDVRRTAAAPPSPQDARAWREALERRLESGQVGPALEALWWWLACALIGAGAAERSWTSRELVARAGRPEVAGPARELDRWLYGPRRPQVPEIRELLARLDRVLA